MSEFIVNEAKFVIDLDDGIKDDLLSPGQILPGGLEIESKLDRAHNFQIYEVVDGSAQVLVVREALMRRWADDGYLPSSAFMRVEASDGEYVYALVSPCSLVMGRVSSLRAYGSLRYALNFAAALQFSRTLNPDISFRDGIYCELYGVVLPSYSRVREVCDHALFLNVLSPDQTEDLSSRAEMSPSELNYYVAAMDLRQHGFALAAEEPLLHSGEIVEAAGFDCPERVCGVTALSENFELYALHGEKQLLLLKPRFAQQLIDCALLEAYQLLNLRLGGEFVRALIFSKRQPAETLNDRHYGLDVTSAFRLALALKKSRALTPQADFTDGLYLAALGVVLPQGTLAEGMDGKAVDRALFASIIEHGPFANAPFDYAELDALKALL